MSAVVEAFHAQREKHMPNDHTEEHRVTAESERNEAEGFRQLAEEAREIRDQHREALERVRQEQEHLREAVRAVLNKPATKSA